MRMAADYPFTADRRKHDCASTYLPMLDSALVRLLIRLFALAFVFAGCLMVFAASSYQEFRPGSYPPAMPVVISTGGGAAVLQWDQVEASPVPLTLADETSGCLDAFHCVEVRAGNAMIRQRLTGGLAWWQQTADTSTITESSVFRLTLVMAFPAFLIAAIVSQLVGWWLRRKARRLGSS